MFKIVESINKAPIRFPIKPGVKIVPGCVVRLNELDGNIVVDISDGENVFGIASNACKNISGRLCFGDIVNVHVQRMIIRTDRFDKKYDIDIGSSLYVNKYGILTSLKPFDKSYIVAKVITPASEQKQFIEALWL
jgi:hypothetical protein